MMGPEYFFGGGMWFMPFVFLTIMLVFLYLVFGRRGYGPPWRGQRGKGNGAREDLESPLDILKRRYANGEISKEEFDHIKKDI